MPPLPPPLLLPLLREDVPLKKTTVSSPPPTPLPPPLSLCVAVALAPLPPTPLVVVTVGSWLMDTSKELWLVMDDRPEDVEVRLPLPKE